MLYLQLLLLLVFACDASHQEHSLSNITRARTASQNELVMRKGAIVRSDLSQIYITLSSTIYGRISSKSTIGISSIGEGGVSIENERYFGCWMNLIGQVLIFHCTVW